MIEEYFDNAKTEMKKLLLKDTDLMKEVVKVYKADKLSIPRNCYPAICLEAGGENPQVGTSKKVNIGLEMNIWFYIPIALKNIKEEEAERSLTKIGAGLIKFLSKYESHHPYWITSNYPNIEYGFKETDRLLRTGVIRWVGDYRLNGGWNND